MYEHVKQTKIVGKNKQFSRQITTTKNYNDKKYLQF